LASQGLDKHQWHMSGKLVYGSLSNAHDTSTMKHIHTFKWHLTTEQVNPLK